MAPTTAALLNMLERAQKGDERIDFSDRKRFIDLMPMDCEQLLKAVHAIIVEERWPVPHAAQ